ncbi:hypothetical protein STAS_05882 [Striga asiatica]|uniref:DCL protein n=1 Tax=Striga asiatica TaxID=4170 RepID=A0A5A7PAQ7_STRAF|nr:hypothetical protein STAS_05882 [Striga asiatica]
MASISALNSPNIPSFHRQPMSKNLILRRFGASFRSCGAHTLVMTNSDGGGPISNGGADLLGEPMASASGNNEDLDDEKGGDCDTWVDWEDRILQETVPVVGFVRMILHSGKYGTGDKLSPEHEKTILEKLLPFHPECEEKIGCGVDYITIGYHPDFESSRCLFIVRKDGEFVDFSYLKCIKGLIRKKYPRYADNFIVWHFGKHRYGWR